MSAQCRSCGASIRFIKTPQGKFMPVDNEAVEVADCEPEDMLVSSLGQCSRQKFISAVDADSYEWYISHFATCPQAEQHRRSK